MGPQYRSIISADTIYTNRGYINTKYIDVVNDWVKFNASGFQGISAEPIDFN